MTTGTMEVTLVGAKGLKNTDFFGKIDPYVVIKYRNQEHTSAIAEGQGTSPMWNEKFKFSVDYPISQGDNINDPNYYSNYKLFLQIMDGDTFTSDDYLGKATIYLKELFEIGVEEGKADLGIQKYRVVLSDRTYHGEIRVGITFTVQATSFFHQMDLQRAGWMDASYAQEIEVCKLNEEKTELKDKPQALQDSWDQETTAHKEKLLGCERHIYNLEQKYQQLVFEKEEAYKRGQVDGSSIWVFGMKCQAQIEHLGGFIEGFDVTKTTNLQDYTSQNKDVVAPDEDRHFCQGR
ncbi:putative Ca2+-dependent phospholipid-binding protein [Handroanthus impetiginosus]|uniref:Putative Ca2+-dependent phospholipid-binding protein n=1 Tax=Handroanthus impetiginosus TaxID=429701 RepID=A0A2G9GEV4_9LAMI|nr:putative Ca2+-dependent phospholipid-binding protein [Handroanthus impetiginosus]